MIDSHCHLDSAQFKKDLAAVLERARQVGITHIVNPGVNLASSQDVVRLAAAQPEIIAAVGVHPHDAKTLDETGLKQLRVLGQHTKVAAIGEIGLDYYRDLSPRNVQKQAFQMQLELAAQLGLPVIIHSRDAHQDVLAMLRDWCAARKSTASSAPGVIHSFSGDVDLAEKFIEIGFYIGISGPVTYPNAEKTRAVVKATPLERLLIETDAPYLSPQVKRGKRNEPAYVYYVAEAIAAVHSCSIKQVVEQTAHNARRLFRIEIS